VSPAAARSSPEHLIDALVASMRDEQGLQGLCDAAARALDRAIVLVSADRRVVAAGGLERREDAFAVLRSATVSAVISVRQTPWGGISTPAPGDATAERLSAHLRRVADFVELEILRSGLPLPSREEARRELLLDLIHARVTSEAGWLMRARRLGAQFDEETRYVALAVAAHAVSARGLAETLVRQGADAVVAQLPTAMLVLAAVPLGSERDAFASRLAASLPEPERAPDGTVVAIGAPAHRLVDAGRALRTARDGLELARGTGGRAVVVTAVETAVDRLLHRLADGDELSRTVDEVLAPLLRAGDRRAPVLIETLDALLAHMHSKAEVARALGIRRQSLYRRLEQLEATLGPLDDPDRRLTLQLALRARRLLTTMPPAQPAPVPL
jgi:purine catabolism regulator